MDSSSSQWSKMSDVQKIVLDCFKEDEEFEILQVIEGATRLLEHHIWKTNLKLNQVIATDVSRERWNASSFLLENIMSNEKFSEDIQKICVSYINFVK